MRGATVPRRISRAVLVLGLALSGALASTSPCLACSCVPSTPEKMLRRADAAFIGAVVNDVMTATGTTQTFQVDEVFKGELGSTVEVWAQVGTEVVNSCSVLYPTGDRVAVLLFDDGEGRWTTQACAHVTQAELRKVGGPAREPVETSSPEPEVAAPVGDLGAGDGEAAMPTWAVVAIGAVVALVLVAGQIAWAARRDRRAARPSGWDPVDTEEPQEVEP